MQKKLCYKTNLKTDVVWLFAFAHFKCASINSNIKPSLCITHFVSHHYKIHYGEVIVRLIQIIHKRSKRRQREMKREKMKRTVLSLFHRQLPTHYQRR